MPTDWSFERVKIKKVRDHKGRLLERHPMINPSLLQQSVAPLVWSYAVTPFKIGRTLGRRFTLMKL